MLIRLFKTYLLPYRKLLLAVLGLQFIQVMCTLTLPTLNADIIDKGILTDNTGYIVRVGAIMLGVTLVQVVFAIWATYYGAKAAMAFGRDVRGGLFHRVTGYSAQEVGHFGAPSLITRITNDVHPGPDPGGHDVHAVRGRPHHHHRRHHPGGARGRAALARPGGGHPPAGGPHRTGDLADGPPVPAHAGAHRPGQPDPARADHRHPGGAGLHPRARGGRPLRRGQRRPHRHLAAGRAAHGLHVPDRAAGAQPVERGRGVARRLPHRQRPDAGRGAGRLPELPGADPHGRDDGHLRGRALAPRRGVRGAHQGGARHRVVGGHLARRRSPSCPPAATSSCAAWASTTPAPRPRS